jgi:hypothetical protein
VRSCIGGFGGGMGGGMCKMLSNIMKMPHIQLITIPAPKILKSFGNDAAKVVNNEGGEAVKLSMEKGPIVGLQLKQKYVIFNKLIFLVHC